MAFTGAHLRCVSIRRLSWANALDVLLYLGHPYCRILSLLALFRKCKSSFSGSHDYLAVWDDRLCCAAAGGRLSFVSCRAAPPAPRTNPRSALVFCHAATIRNLGELPRVFFSRAHHRRSIPLQFPV